MAYIRTQVYFDSDDFQIIEMLAASEGVKKAEIMRRVVKQGIVVEMESKKKKKKSAGEGLLAMAEDAKKRGISGPVDLAENMDEYLYGSKSKYANK